MKKPRKNVGSKRAPVKESKLYRRFLAEREEVIKLQHQLTQESERFIRFEDALKVWIKKHRREWADQWDLNN